MCYSEWGPDEYMMFHNTVPTDLIAQKADQLPTISGPSIIDNSLHFSFTSSILYDSLCQRLEHICLLLPTYNYPFSLACEASIASPTCMDRNSIPTHLRWKWKLATQGKLPTIFKIYKDASKNHRKLPSQIVLITIEKAEKIYRKCPELL